MLFDFGVIGFMMYLCAMKQIMKKTRQDKWNLEREAADLFIHSYNALHGAEFVLTKHIDKPDFVATDKELGLSVGIEITHLFYDEDEARLLLGKTSNHVIADEVVLDKLVSVLNNRLKTKSEKAKHYQYYNDMILVIRVASPVFDKATFDALERYISIPQTTVFDQIWLLFHSESGVVDDNLKRLK